MFKLRYLHAHCVNDVTGSENHRELWFLCLKKLQLDLGNDFNNSNSDSKSNLRLRASDLKEFLEINPKDLRIVDKFPKRFD